MKIRACRPALGAFALLGVLLCAASARAADYTTIILTINVDEPADVVWKKVGSFCDIGAWLKLKCVYTSGSGALGTVRRLADRIDEVMVGNTPHSYTYAQPGSKIFYHGTVDVQAQGAHRSRIVYSLFYDQSQMTTDQAKAAYRTQHEQMFNGALDAMKKMAEAQ